MVTTETVYIILDIQSGKYLSTEYDYVDNIEQSQVYKLKKMAEDSRVSEDEIVITVQRTWAVNIVGVNNGS